MILVVFQLSIKRVSDMRLVTNFLLLSVSAMVLFACARSEIIQTSRNQAMIATTAAPVCGTAGAYRVSQQMAAVATIRQGFKRFLLSGAGSSSNIGVIQGPSTTTGTITTVGGTSFVNANTSSTPIVFGGHSAQLMVTMLNPGDPGYEDGLDPKKILGPKWEKKVEQGIKTCRDEDQ